jgi:hypothetical protein
MARNNHPAASLDPSDRANHPFMTMPTPAKARAAARSKKVETLRDGASPSRATSCTVTVGGGVTGGGSVTSGSANAESAEKNPSGISNSEDGDLLFGKAAGFPSSRFRCL